MANLSQLTIPVKNPSTGEITNQTFGIVGGSVTIDPTPTHGSANAVSSGGVYDYIDTMITQALSASY